MKLKNVDRLVAHWFFVYWASVLLFLLMLLALGACRLPGESQNYNPQAPYRWTEPAMWKEAE